MQPLYLPSRFITPSLIALSLALKLDGKQKGGWGRPNVSSAKCPLAKCPFGQMSVGQMSIGQMSGSRTNGGRTHRDAGYTLCFLVVRAMVCNKESGSTERERVEDQHHAEAGYRQF